MELHIGVDDTDSRKGMCTTYLAAVLKDRLERFADVSELSLVRLNPNIPWKTRGNGAVTLNVETKEVQRTIDETLSIVEELSTLEEKGTEPGVAILCGKPGPEITSFYHRALHGIVTIREAEKVAEREKCRVYKFKKGRGIIGALAAIGADKSTHTYEIIAYRARENWGTTRRLDQASVFEMDVATYPHTFNNVDRETSHILITPRAPCPVFFGIRGRSRRAVERAMDMLRLEESVERHATFKTNQGTDAHLVPCSISQATPFSSVIVDGIVIEEPHVIKGGHVVFKIAENGSNINCAAYEPTGTFRNIVKSLRCEDVVKAFGGVKDTKGLTVNLEKLEILELKRLYTSSNPVCPECNKSMKSSGRGQGFRCKKCKSKVQSKVNRPIQRELKTGFYCVPPRAMRHLTKPVIEDGGTMTKTGS